MPNRNLWWGQQLARRVMALFPRELWGLVRVIVEEDIQEDVMECPVVQLVPGFLEPTPEAVITSHMNTLHWL